MLSHSLIEKKEKFHFFEFLALKFSMELYKYLKNVVYIYIQYIYIYILDTCATA